MASWLLGFLALGLWAYGLMGLWAYGLMGLWAYGLLVCYAEALPEMPNRAAFEHSGLHA
jgi:hypothetical protein